MAAKICLSDGCLNVVPSSLIVDGKRRNLCNRTLCLECLPFGQSRYRKKSEDEERSHYGEVSRRWYLKKKEELGGCPIAHRRFTRKKAIFPSGIPKCYLCGYDRYHGVVDFHHVEKGKEFGVGNSKGFQLEWKTVLSELRKCVPLCSNCHREVHAGLVSELNIRPAFISFQKHLDNISVFKSWKEVEGRTLES